MFDPAILLDMVEVDVATGKCISMGGSKNASPPKLQGFIFSQVVMILSIEHTVSESLPGSNTEEVARQPCALGIDVVERWAFLRCYASAHGAHAEAHALVAVDEVGEDLRGGSHRDAALVAELMESTLHA